MSVSSEAACTDSRRSDSVFLCMLYEYFGWCGDFLVNGPPDVQNVGVHIEIILLFWVNLHGYLVRIEERVLNDAHFCPGGSSDGAFSLLVVISDVSGDVFPAFAVRNDAGGNDSVTEFDVESPVHAVCGGGCAGPLGNALQILVFC